MTTTFIRIRPFQTYGYMLDKVRNEIKLIVREKKDLDVDLNAIFLVLNYLNLFVFLVKFKTIFMRTLLNMA